MRKVSPLLLMGFLASAAFGQFNPKTDMIFTAKDAVVVMPPTVVTKGKPESGTWSRDGKWLFLESTETKIDAKSLASHIIGDRSGSQEASETVLSIFGVDKRNQLLLSRFPSKQASLDQVEWLPGNRMVAFLMTEVTAKSQEEEDSSQVLYVASTGNGQATQLLRVPETAHIEIHTHPLARGAVVAITEESKDGKSTTRASWLGSDGKLGAPIQMKDGFFGFYWDAKGVGPYVAQREVNRETRKVKVDYFLLNFQTGAVTPTDEPAWESPEGAQPGFTVKYGASISELSLARVQRRSLWLESTTESDHKFALITPEANEYEMSPNSDAIYYESQGIGMVRMLPRVSKEDASKALQALVMRDAKQVGLALLMYSGDYDDEMPINNGDWMDNVLPYIKDRGVMDGFTYTYSGGSLTEVKDPANTEMGYKEGPGGRAVVYADGHVKWIPNPGPVAIFTDRRVVAKGERQISLCIV